MLRGVFYLARPDDATLRRALARAESLDFNYPEVGATAEQRLPAGYTTDRYGCELGSGRRSFDSARRAVEAFEMYPSSWIDVIALGGIRSGTTFGSLIRHLGFWSFNPGRIIDVVDESSDERARYGFAFGTLWGHAERGEERFEVSWDRARDVVSFDVVAFSRPRHVLARIGAPIARQLQLRFHRESCQSMRRAVSR